MARNERLKTKEERFLRWDALCWGMICNRYMKKFAITDNVVVSLGLIQLRRGFFGKKAHTIKRYLERVFLFTMLE